MVSFFAIAGREVRSGGLGRVLAWARAEAQAGRGPVKVAKARADEDSARVVFEIEAGAERIIVDGRRLPLAKLKRAAE